jgi:hypothetical protein
LLAAGPTKRLYKDWCFGTFCIFLDYTKIGGLEHGFYFSISYMGCHPNPIDEVHHFQDGEIAPATSNQLTQINMISLDVSNHY